MISMKFFSLILILFCVNPIFSNDSLCPRSKRSSLPLIQREGPIIILNLTGSNYDMGLNYGKAISKELRYSLDTLQNFFESHKGSYQDMLQQANIFQNRYSDEWNWFLKGIAAGSGLTYDDCKILNAMETLVVPSPKNSAPSLVSGCAFAYVPSSKTTSGQALIGRNYDYPSPFDKIAKNLIVTVFNQENKISAAIIGMPGQIYCPTCLNAQGHFLELNNGMPSGGEELDQVKPSMLIRMLDTLRTSPDFDEVSKKLNNVRSDFSLIVNAASSNGGVSFEYSTRNKTVKNVSFDEKTPFVSTNFFLNSDWSLPAPTDNETFIGVTRRENLLELIEKFQPISRDGMKKIMDTNLTDGGAKWTRTIYQIVYDYDKNILALKVPKTSDEWVEIDMNIYF